MPYSSVPTAGFGGGLDLRSQPDNLDPTSAIDLLNVEFTEKGSVRQRDGYARFTVAALTNQPDSLAPFYKSDGTKLLLVGNGNRLDVVDTNGQSIANTTAPTTSPHFFARYGGPTGERIYIANGTDAVRRYDTTAGFTSPTGFTGQTGKFLAVWQNRLVVAGETGTTAGNTVSSVVFSATGDPENFTSTVYVDLGPGDGERIMGMATFRDQLVVFKESRFFVFYGVGVNADGTANPQWRAVEAGVGLVASRALTTARDGIYFLGRAGVYKTTGQDPQIVSEKVEPLFGGTPSPFFKSLPLNMAQIGNAAMCWHRERIYLSLATGVSATNDRMLVLDPRYGWWSLYDIPATSMASFRIGAVEELVFGYVGTQKYIGRHAPQFVTDQGNSVSPAVNPVVARWRSGFTDMGSTEVKTVRETKVWGEGQATYRITTDFDENTTGLVVQFSNTNANDVWTTNPTDVWTDDPTDIWGGQRMIAPRLLRQARRGTLFSTQFENAQPAVSFAVHRLDHHVRDKRNPSTTRTEATT